MNLSLPFNWAFILMMNCAIGISLHDGNHIKEFKFRYTSQFQLNSIFKETIQRRSRWTLENSSPGKRYRSLRIWDAKPKYLRSCHIYEWPRSPSTRGTKKRKVYEIKRQQTKRQLKVERGDWMGNIVSTQWQSQTHRFYFHLIPIW